MTHNPDDKALILTPYYGGLDMQHLGCVQELVRRGWLHVMVNNCALVDHARAALAGLALRDTHGFDMVLWVDHDIVFSALEAYQLIQTARELNAMVGAAVIVKKVRGPLMCIGVERGTTLHFDREKGGPVPCMGVPFGFTAMPLAELKRVCESVGPSIGVDGAEVWPAFACTRAHGSGSYMSEDYSFCQRYRDLGGKVYLDTRPRVGHKGSYVYTIEDGAWAIPDVDSFDMLVGAEKTEYPEPPLEAFG